MKRKYSISVIISFILLILFVVGDILAVYSVADHLSNSKTVQGKVVDVITKHGNRSTSYSSIIQYRAHNDQDYRIVTTGEKKIGETVDVVYDKRDPGLGFASSLELWIFVIICSLGVLITFLIGYNKLKKSRKNI